MASIRQLKTGFRAEVCVSGVRDSGMFDTRPQAKAWAAKRETELRENAEGKLPDHTLAFALERYRDDVSSKKKGFKWESDRIGLILREFPHLCKLPIAKITTDDFVKWRDTRLKSVSASSVKREASLLSALFTVARLEWKWVKENPFSDLSLPQAAPHRDRRITDDEVERLCIAMSYEPAKTPTTLTQQVCVAFLFALESAMRAGEIRGLTWDRVNLKDRYVRLIETKNGGKRNVPLSLKAVALLEQMKGLDDKRVFTVEEGSFVTLFRKARDRCKIENLHFHDSRHEACTRLARKLEVLDLARMIGHRDLKSLMIYYNATAAEIASRLD